VLQENFSTHILQHSGEIVGGRHRHDAHVHDAAGEAEDKSWLEEEQRDPDRRQDPGGAEHQLVILKALETRAGQRVAGE